MALNPLTVDEIAATAESMLRCSQKLSQAVQVMKDEGLAEIHVHWSDTTYRALQRVLKIGAEALSSADEAVWAKRNNRPTLAEQEKARAARDNAKRKKPDEPPKKRGRPRKSS